MFTRTKIALVVLGVLGTASMALANDSGEDKGGYVVPGSLDGVNPVYHPGIFRSSDAAKAYGFAASSSSKHIPKVVR